METEIIKDAEAAASTPPQDEDIEIKSKIKCEKCGRSMAEDKFYTKRNGEKFTLCKNCLTLHVDNADPKTFTWILEEADVPYVPSKWNSFYDRAFARNPYKLTGTSVLGKYLSSMKLNNFKDKGWADSEELIAEIESRERVDLQKREAKEAKLKKQLEEGTISEALYKTYMSTITQAKELPLIPPSEVIGGKDNPFNETYFVGEQILQEVDPGAQLTKEDMIYLATKWGKNYRPDEWISLEKNYKEMEASFAIEDADTISTLILLCKVNLKLNLAIDSNDMESAAKAQRMYDSLRKSAKFTAALNKEDKVDYIDCIGELVAMCEREGGFIPRYCTDIPQDKVDYTIRDMQLYTHRLIAEDLGLGQQIEDTIKKMEIQRQMELDEKNASVEEGIVLSDDDHSDYFEAIEELINKDLDIYEEPEA